MYSAQYSGNYKFFDNNLGIWQLAIGEREEAKKLVVWVCRVADTHPVAVVWCVCGVAQLFATDPLIPVVGTYIPLLPHIASYIPYLQC